MLEIKKNIICIFFLLPFFSCSKIYLDARKKMLSEEKELLSENSNQFNNNLYNTNVLKVERHYIKYENIKYGIFKLYETTHGILDKFNSILSKKTNPLRLSNLASIVLGIKALNSIEIAEAKNFTAENYDPPKVVNFIKTMKAYVDEPFIYNVPMQNERNRVFNGVDLTLSAIDYDQGVLNDFLSFDNNTNTFNGIPTTRDVGYHDILLTAKDAFDRTADITFTIDVEETKVFSEYKWWELVLAGGVLGIICLSGCIIIIVCGLRSKCCSRKASFHGDKISNDSDDDVISTKEIKSTKATSNDNEMIKINI